MIDSQEKPPGPFSLVLYLNMNLAKIFRSQGWLAVMKLDGSGVVARLLQIAEHHRLRKWYH